MGSRKLTNLYESSPELEFNTNTSPTLTIEQQNEANVLANRIDISNIESVLSFGTDIQKELKNFTHNLFIHVQQANTNPIRETLFQLQQHLEKMNTDQLINLNDSFFSKLFKRNRKSPQEVISEYHRLSKIIDRISIQLQHAQKNLIDDSDLLDKIYEQNMQYFEKLNVYIVAAEKKKQQLINEDLKKFNEEELNHPIKRQELQDVENAIEWLDRRIYDMQISREIAIQTAPQIRMIQQTNHLLIEKIQTSILTTIPLWQTQISMIVNLNKHRRMQQASERFSEQIKNGVQLSSKDMQETIHELKQTQSQLIGSIEEALVVQASTNEHQNALEQSLEQMTSSS